MTLARNFCLLLVCSIFVSHEPSNGIYRRELRATRAPLRAYPSPCQASWPGLVTGAETRSPVAYGLTAEEQGAETAKP